MATVYVVNRGAHDFSPAKQYGELVFMSEGTMSKYAMSNMHRTFMDFLKDSKPEDMILITSLTSMCCIATAIMTHLHGKVNFLLYKDERYVKRTINLKGG